MLEPRKNRLLISEPFMPDPTFHRTLVYLVEYGKEGAVGFVLNQPTGLGLHQLVDEIEREDITVYNGGPVGQDTVHFLHRDEKMNPGTEETPPYWGGSFDLLKVLMEQNAFDPGDYLFFLGYSGWAPGQLETELDEEAWIVSDLDFDPFVSQPISTDEIWRNAMRKLGGRYALLANSPDNPFLN